MAASRLQWCACLLAGLLPPAALAQRVEDNAVTSADDAFGTSVGTQAIGLYDAEGVRGFSPKDAGNLRIEGLYFDQQTFEARPMRVGARNASFTQVIPLRPGDLSPGDQVTGGVEPGPPRRVNQRHVDPV